MIFTESEFFDRVKSFGYKDKDISLLLSIQKTIGFKLYMTYGWKSIYEYEEYNIQIEIENAKLYLYLTTEEPFNIICDESSIDNFINFLKKKFIIELRKVKLKNIEKTIREDELIEDYEKRHQRI